jgi:hypothetical protein
MRGSSSKGFFFEKKNQKTFSTLRPLGGETGRHGESLFASFSSEKEESFYRDGAFRWRKACS